MTPGNEAIVSTLKQTVKALVAQEIDGILQEARSQSTYRIEALAHWQPWITVRMNRREMRICDQLLAAKLNKEIALILNFPIGTVKFYIHKLFYKTGTQTRFDLALWWLVRKTEEAALAKAAKEYMASPPLDEKHDDDRFSDDGCPHEAPPNELPTISNGFPTDSPTDPACDL